MVSGRRASGEILLWLPASVAILTRAAIYLGASMLLQKCRAILLGSVVDCPGDTSLAHKA